MADTYDAQVKAMRADAEARGEGESIFEHWTSVPDEPSALFRRCEPCDGCMTQIAGSPVGYLADVAPRILEILKQHRVPGRPGDLFDGDALERCVAARRQLDAEGF
ncbi:MAG TPA: hypothetical protein VM487_13870 [Phycisphaerae bacterium]|nr:hypothetical protein [Phycisphaerae bacterium]